MIYHILSKREWESAQQRGGYAPPSLADEGFIHCSTARQVVHVANAFYRGRTDLVLLQIDENRIKPEVRWEAPAGPAADTVSQTDLFPHIYGPLNLDAVASVLNFQPDPATGAFSSLNT